MLGLCCLVLLGAGLAPSRGAGHPGAVLRIDIGTMDRAISTVLAESDVLQKMAEEATKKKLNPKLIKGISGVKVKGIEPPVIRLGLCPGTGLSMAVLVRMTIAGKSFMGGYMEITLAANMTVQGRLAQDALGTPRFRSENCRIALISVKTNLPNHLLPNVFDKFLDRTLQKVLPPLLCPAVDAVLSLLNAKLATLTAEMPLGLAGTLRYALLPAAVNEAFIRLDLKAILRRKDGSESELPAEQPPLPALPPKPAAATQLVLSAALLSATLRAQPGAFALDVTDTMVLGLPPLVTSMLGTLIPEVSAVLPPSQPLLIAMRAASAPLVTVTAQAASVRLASTAAFVASPAGAAPQPLFVLHVRCELGARFAAGAGRLHVTLALRSVAGLAVAASSVGTFDEQPLRGLLADVIHVAYLPSISEALRGGIPLPELLGVRYERAALRGAQDALVLDVPTAANATANVTMATSATVTAET